MITNKGLPILRQVEFDHANNIGISNNDMEILEATLDRHINDLDSRCITYIYSDCLYLSDI
jgi:hypothetical protein